MNYIAPFMKVTNRPLRDNIKRSTSLKKGKFLQRGKGVLEAMSYTFWTIYMKIIFKRMVNFLLEKERERGGLEINSNSSYLRGHQTFE